MPKLDVTPLRENEAVQLNESSASKNLTPARKSKTSAREKLKMKEIADEQEAEIGSEVSSEEEAIEEKTLSSKKRKRTVGKKSLDKSRSVSKASAALKDTPSTSRKSATSEDDLGKIPEEGSNIFAGEWKYFKFLSE